MMTEKKKKRRNGKLIKTEDGRWVRVPHGMPMVDPALTERYGLKDATVRLEQLPMKSLVTKGKSLQQHQAKKLPKTKMVKPPLIKVIGQVPTNFMDDWGRLQSNPRYGDRCTLT